MTGRSDVTQQRVDWRVFVAVILMGLAFAAACLFQDYVPFASIWAVVIASAAFASPRESAAIGLLGLVLSVVGGLVTGAADTPIFWIRMAVYCVIAFVGVGLAVQRTRRERLLIERATTDALTGLANRRLLVERLEAQLEVRSSGTRSAVLYADLDQFKEVNDSLGHAAGDEVLVRAGERLSACTRPAETLARFGGDEFVIACPRVDGRDDVAALCDRILAAFSDAFDAGQSQVSVGITIGVAIAPAGAFIEPARLIDAADEALTACKRTGRGSYEIVEIAA